MHWKNKLSFISFLIVFISCGDNLKIEKDRHPEIPEFPKFFNDSLMYKKLDVVSVSYLDNQSKKIEGEDFVIHTNDYFYYTINDSVLFIITGYSEAIEPGMEFPAKNFITLTRIRNGKVEKKNWTEECKQDLFIHNDGNKLHIGKRSIDLSSMELKYAIDSLYADSFPKDSVNIKSWDFSPNNFKNYKIYDSSFVKEFDRVTVNSVGKLSGGVNNGIGWTKYAVPLIYYSVNKNEKQGKTKINFDEQKAPLLIKAGGDIYCVIYSEPLSVKRKIKNYEIGTLE